MEPTGSELREIFSQTVVVRRPTYGIISGYHDLPYVCLGESFEPGSVTTVVRGKVHVSPQFVIRPPQYNPSYDEIFGAEYTDRALVGRIFGYFGFRERPVECKSEHLELTHVDLSIDEVLSDTLNDLERREDLTTGVVITPNAQYFPVSVERFITAVLEDEFGE